MSKAELLAALRGACAALDDAFAAVAPGAWETPTTFERASPHDLLRAAQGLLELAGNWYLQSLRLTPAPAFPDRADLARHAGQRRQRPLAVDRADYHAATRGLLILVDMADAADLAQPVAGQPRAAWLASIPPSLDLLRAAIAP